jgi:UDP-N-acetylglucosamine:LPS N-acetylglucosamine transferase
VQEAIAARTPVIISQVVPGQEEGNARLIVDNNCGCLAPDPEAILAALDSAFEHGEKRLRSWVTNLGRLSKPDASLQIARFILELVSPESGRSEKMQHLLPAESERKDARPILHSDGIYSQGI